MGFKIPTVFEIKTKLLRAQISRQKKQTAKATTQLKKEARELIALEKLQREKLSASNIKGLSDSEKKVLRARFNAKQKQKEKVKKNLQDFVKRTTPIIKQAGRVLVTLAEGEQPTRRRRSKPKKKAAKKRKKATKKRKKR